LYDALIDYIQQREEPVKSKVTPIDREYTLADDEFIVSKTDLKGRITYANRIFMKIAKYSEAELLGVQHNIIRHPDMPRGVFRLLWNVLEQGNECFAYVKNLAADGSFYWVFANVTPDLDHQGKTRGYFSVRRKPSRDAIATITPIYQQMLQIEQNTQAATAPDESLQWLSEQLEQMGTSYERFITSLQPVE